MAERELKLTDLDYAVGNHHLQMMKAALPYMEIPQQRIFSMFIKWNELRRTMEFFRENDDGMLSVCALESGRDSPADMLSAVRPYANEREQEIIDMMSRFLQARNSRNMRGGGPMRNMDQILSLLSPEQRSRFETIQMMIQTMNQI